MVSSWSRVTVLSNLDLIHNNSAAFEKSPESASAFIIELLLLNWNCIKVNQGSKSARALDLKTIVLYGNVAEVKTDPPKTWIPPNPLTPKRTQVIILGCHPRVPCWYPDIQPRGC
ncbi:hypothetical protein WG66_011042 [Moniliophthora roreri]|nr:hypothetical protein WG66_011042 [Moniliophthora roreri]